MSDSTLQREAPLTGRYWLVVSLLLVLLPHLTRLPVWLAVTALLVVAWRLWRDYRNGPLPGAGLRLLLTVSGIGAIFVVFRTILGHEAGTALLSVMICLKLLELRTLRDAMLALFLGYFLVLAGFLFDDSIFTGFYLFAVVLALSASLIVLNHPNGNLARTPFYLQRAGALLLQALPLMVVLFILFPRLNSPLWRIPEPTTQALTGLGDEMSPGDITHLVESDELVFRAEFSGTLPSADRLYWRGPVLWHTDGHRWRKLLPQELAVISPNALRYEPLSEPVLYSVMLEPQKGQMLFALDLPARPPQVEGGAQLLADFQLLSLRPLTHRIRYAMSSATSYHTGALQPGERLHSLQLPPQANPRTRALAQQWRTTLHDDAALVQHALDFVRNEPFFYTRQPPRLGNDPVDQFLFETRQGFCEHYAAAFVTLMRAAAIPARVVTGYQGGDFNAVGRFLEVRQNDAHAWAEVWLEQRGWMRVDPTAVIPAGRVLAQQDTARFQSTTPIVAIGESSLLHSGLVKMVQGWNAMNYGWSVWVVGFNAERQQALLKRWGIDSFDLRTLASLLLISVGMVLALVALAVLYRRPRSKDPALHLYQRFCRRLVRAGITCPPHEGPQQLAARAGAALPRHAARIDEIVSHYMALRYGRADPARLADLKALVKRFHP